jgi:hypothetical protein
MKALSYFQSLRSMLERRGHDTVLALADAIDTLDFAAAEKLVLDMLKQRDNA